MKKKQKNFNSKALFMYCTLILCYLVIGTPLTAQTQGCIVYVDSSQELTTPPQACGNSIDYAPSNTYPERTPIKRIRMVWHFMCDDNGQGNFNDVDITNSNHNNQSAYWGKVMKEINNRMKGLAAVTRQDPNHPTPHIPDSRIQFDIQQSNIVYHDNTAQMNNPNGWTSHYSQYVTNDPSMPYKEDALHIFFYPNTYGSGTSWASLLNNRLVQNGDWDIFNHPNNTNNSMSWSTGGSMLHEMLHCLGLNHTNRFGGGGCNTIDNDGCDDTPVGGPLNPCPCWNGNASDGLPCSNNVMDYNASKSALSRCQIGKLHYNLIHHANVNPYMMEDFCSHQSTENITIQNGQNIIWKNTRYLKGDIIIEDGATLTIECVVSFGFNSRIYIEAGGKLIVDGGRLTAICASDWKGIRVAGNSSLSQNDVNQGVVELKNEAIIEHARDAIALIGLKINGDLDWSKTGGIVRAENSTFLNNRRDVEFMSYHSFATNGREYNNKSYFEECSFITDEDVKGSFTPNTHITMWDVNGVSITGCVFEDKRSYIDPAFNGVRGIYTIKSGYYVRRKCGFSYPCSGAKSKFINLKQGIESHKLGNPQKSIYISGSEFTSYRGVALVGINHARVSDNIFDVEVSIFAPFPNFYPAGLYLDHSTGFRVYNNTFNADADQNNSAFGGVAGLVVRRSGANNDNFRNNTFNNLITASQSIGYNRDALGTKGLTFRCNEYNDNKDDFFITSYANDPGPHNTAGVHPLQGISLTGSSKGADNLFGNSSPILNYNIENNGSWINYAHRDPNIHPRTEPSIVTSRVNLIQLSGSRVCGVSYNTLDPSVEWGKVNALKPLVVGKRTSHEASVDGGNTQGRLQDIQAADPITVNDVYNDILGDAPWVSDEVLITIAGIDAPFTDEMITDILVACPQAARSLTIQTILDGRSNPLSQQQRDDINAEQSTFTDYDDFLKEWADYSDDYQEAINNIVHLYSEDQVDHLSDLDLLLKDEDNINNYYLLAEIYFGKGMDIDAGNVLTLIPTTFNLSPEQQIHYNDFVSYHATLNQWEDDGKLLTNLDPADISWLQSFSQNKEIVFANSIALLKLNEESDYYGDVYIPATAGSSTTQPTSVGEIAKEEQLKIYPNPATSILNITTEKAISSLVIRDMIGKEVISRSNLSKGEHSINVSQLSKGMYILSIESKGETKSYKFVKE